MAAAALSRGDVSRVILTRPGGGGRRAPRLPSRRHPGQGRSLSAPALRRALRHARSRAGQLLLRARHDRGRAAGLHEGPHAERLLRHPRRGPEHEPRADEDVPHPARLRLQDRRHRRHHPDRPGEGLTARDWSRSATSSIEVQDINFIRFGGEDVVRHKLVQRIVAAYGEAESRDRSARATAGAADIDLSDVPGDLRRAVGAALHAAGVSDGHIGVEIVGRGPDANAQLRGARGGRGDRRPRLPDRRPASTTRAPESSATSSSARSKATDVTEAAVHGALHLCGFDHEADQRARCSSCRPRSWPRCEQGGLRRRRGAPERRQVDPRQRDRRRPRRDRLRAPADHAARDPRRCHRPRPRTGSWCMTDLPGVQRPRDALTERMQRRVEREIADSDAVLFVINAEQGVGPGRPLHLQGAAPVEHRYARRLRGQQGRPAQQRGDRRRPRRGGARSKGSTRSSPSAPARATASSR